MQAIVRRSTRIVEALGRWEHAPVDPDLDVVELRDDQVARLSEPGQKTLEADGTITVTPPPPPPPPVIVFFSEQPMGGMVRTTTAVATEIYRLPLSLLTGYTALATLVGVDAASGAVRVVRASAAFKRLAGAALQVGVTVVVANHTDAGASTWAVSAGVAGNDFVVTVTGAAGRTIDWSLAGVLTRFSPGGIA